VAQPHRARRLVLQGLCCYEVQGDSVRELIDAFMGEAKDGPDTVNAAKRLLTDALAERDACDAVLSGYTGRWDLKRLAQVDRNILRLATYELRTARVPPKVAISEAVKLAHEFSTAESPRFVNGILDAVARDIQTELGTTELDDK
jgi:transcription antitermination protein NusB